VIVLPAAGGGNNEKMRARLFLRRNDSTYVVKTFQLVRSFKWLFLQFGDSKEIHTIEASIVVSQLLVTNDAKGLRRNRTLNSAAERLIR
jgi:hypothetical protein